MGFITNCTRAINTLSAKFGRFVEGGYVHVTNVFRPGNPDLSLDGIDYIEHTFREIDREYKNSEYLKKPTGHLIDARTEAARSLMDYFITGAKGALMRKDPVRAGSFILRAVPLCDEWNYRTAELWNAMNRTVDMLAEQDRDAGETGPDTWTETFWRELNEVISKYISERPAGTIFARSIETMARREQSYR